MLERDSNPPHSASEADALPMSYPGACGLCSAGHAGKGSRARVSKPREVSFVQRSAVRRRSADGVGRSGVEPDVLRVGLQRRGARKRKGARSSAAGARPFQGPAYQAGAGRAGGACGLAAMERAKLDRGLDRYAEAGGVEPQPIGSIRLANGARATASSSSSGRKVQESNPDARAPPGFRDRCLHHADLTFQRIVLAAGIEPEAGCERPGTAPAVNRGRDGSSRALIHRRREGWCPAAELHRAASLRRRRSGSTGQGLVHA